MHPEDNRAAGRQGFSFPEPIWPIVSAILVVIAVVGVVYGFHVSRQARELAASQQALSSTLGQMQQQMRDLAGRMTALSAAQQQAAAAAIERARPSPAAEVAAPPAPPARRRPAVRQAAARPAPDDPRWKKMESRLSEQNEKIASTERQVEQTREELEGRLGSTKDELSTSIGRTHAEVLALQKRGERDYHEFSLAKSKDFRRVGPVSLSLRKADTKHKRYDLELIVEDVKLQKKNVNLYEPVYLTVSELPQPVELVVNQVDKNQVKGYLSLPKYKKSELTADAAARGKLSQAESPR